MITKEQINRTFEEFTQLSCEAYFQAKSCEMALETYTCCISAPQYRSSERERFFQEFKEADYKAKSTAFIRNLIKEYIDKNKL